MLDFPDHILGENCRCLDLSGPVWTLSGPVWTLTQKANMIVAPAKLSTKSITAMGHNSINWNVIIFTHKSLEDKTESDGPDRSRQSVWVLSGPCLDRLDLVETQFGF